MRSMNSLVMLALIFGTAGMVVAQKPEAVTLTRLYTGADGLSHFEPMELKFAPVPGAPNTLAQSEAVPTKKSYIVRIQPGFFEDWHNADVRRYVITISGRSEVEVAGGQKFVVQPGQVVLAEDLTGKGHTFRVLGTSDWVALFVDFEK
jgi:quercetin dioxygenase-like cupin family protein